MMSGRRRVGVVVDERRVGLRDAQDTLFDANSGRFLRLRVEVRHDLFLQVDVCDLLRGRIVIVLV